MTKILELTDKLTGDSSAVNAGNSLAISKPGMVWGGKTIQTVVVCYISC